jgi:predicted TIM-barrel fold metal-dependent hydrolase
MAPSIWDVGAAVDVPDASLPETTGRRQDRMVVVGSGARGIAAYYLYSECPVPVIDRVAEAHPGLSIVINHFGLAGGSRDDDAFTDFGNLLALRKHPNVAVKASCLPFYTTQPYPFRNLHDYIRRAYDAFGPKRLFWGTDLSRLPCAYRQGVTLFTEELPWLLRSDKEWIMGRGVCEWLGWPYHNIDKASEAVESRCC